MIFQPKHEKKHHLYCAQQTLRSACAFAESDPGLCCLCSISSLRTQAFLIAQILILVQLWAQNLIVEFVTSMRKYIWSYGINAIFLFTSQQKTIL